MVCWDWPWLCQWFSLKMWQTYRQTQEKFNIDESVRKVNGSMETKWIHESLGDTSLPPSPVWTWTLTTLTLEEIHILISNTYPSLHWNNFLAKRFHVTSQMPLSVKSLWAPCTRKCSLLKSFEKQSIITTCFQNLYSFSFFNQITSFTSNYFAISLITSLRFSGFQEHLHWINNFFSILKITKVTLKNSRQG